MHDVYALGGRTGRLENLGAQRQQQLPCHDVVAVLVDAAYDFAEWW